MTITEFGTKGDPEKPEGFLGRRKHNGAVSFSARKTISGVCADEVADSFAEVTLKLNRA